MAKPLVSDELWRIVESLLPPEPAHPKGGHPFTVAARAALTGIIFVLKTGIPWEYLPQEMGCGSGMTCWRRLRDWQAAGVWHRLHRVLLDRLGEAGKIDWSRASADCASVPAKGVKRGDRAPATSAPIRPTGASRAPNTTWSATGRACRWPRGRARPT
jgi:transposase